MPEEAADTNAGVGLIFPPPDIRGVIDKTAQFVAKCGPEFEQRVLREQNHTKFAFLLPSNPYRPYYEHKVKEFKTGVVEEKKPEVAATEEPDAKKAKVEETKEPEYEEPDAVPSKAAKVKETVGFSASEMTLNAIPTLDSKLLMTISEGGMAYLTAGARANVAQKAGRYMFEAKIVQQMSPNVRGPNPRQMLRVGFSTAGSSLMLGDDDNNVCFDADGSYMADKKRVPGKAQIFKGTVVGVVLNLDQKSPNANTVALYCDGKRVSEPKPLPENLKGKPLFPHVCYRNLSVHVNFGGTQMAPLPFKCDMLQGAVAADVVASSSKEPKDGKYEVVMPTGLPDEGTFDWLEGFLEKNPHYVELSDRKILEWARCSGHHSRADRRGSLDKPIFNFDVPALNDMSVKKLIDIVAPLVPRNYVIMEVAKNLISSDRKDALKQFSNPCYKKIAKVVMGEPDKEFKDKVQSKLLKEKQERCDAEWKNKKAEQDRRKEIAARQKEAVQKRKEAEKAAQEAEKAAEAARKKAEEEGKDPDEAAANAAKAAKKKADLDTMKAAKDVEKDLKEAEQGATKLDTGLHPHGDKWWRYRYEHSYIESLIMIFICWLFLVWSEFVTHMKRRIKGWSSDRSSDPETVEEHEENHRAESHGVVYLVWLNTFAEQMMVCLLVFLTVWLIAKTHLAEFFPMIIKPSEDMRVPNTAGEYRRLALDICTIFFFAIVFYFSLMFPVAHDARIMTSELEEFENKASGSSQAAERKKKVSAATLGTVAETANDFVLVKRHFQNHMEHEIKYNDNPGYKEISAMLNDDLTKFPLWMYLKMNVRESISVFFKFDWRLWLPIIGLFVVFMLLHRFAHMGYVRIMGFFAMMTLALIIVISCFTKSIAHEIHNVDEVEAGPRKKSIHEDYNTESIALCLLQFAMFVVCYGVARMICQPWMWELHFWPVFSLTLLALFSAFLFVWLVCPAIPRFCAAMAMPPYVDADNLQQMHAVASSVQGAVRTGGKKRIQRNSTGILSP